MALALVSLAALISPRVALAQRDAPQRDSSQRDSSQRAQARSDSVRAIARDSGAAVTFGTDTLFRLYGRLGPFGPGERAAAATDRLQQVAPTLARGDSVTIVDRGSYTDLMVRGVVVATVLDDDAARLGTTRAALARADAARLRAAVVDAARRTSTSALLTDAAYAVIATLVLLALLWLLAMGFSRLYRRIETLRRVRFSALRIQNFELLSAGRLTAILDAVARVVRVLLTLLLFYIYVPLVLGFFPWTAPLSHRIIGYAIRPFAVAWLELVAYLPNVFYLAAGVLMVRWLLAFLHTLFGAIGTRAITVRGFYPEWAEPTYKIVRVLVFAFAITVLYPYLPGAHSDAFKGVSIFIGVLFSLGSSSAIGNMVAGVVLTYTRAFQIGDRVQIGGTVGDVMEKTLLITRVRTIKNVAVTIPNGTVLGAQVINFSMLAPEHGLILHTTVTIGYDAPWRRVHELLIEAARRTEHILPEPAPFVLQTSLDDFYVSYEINATTDRPDLMAVTYARLHENIRETFDAGGVEIMSPHYTSLRDGNHTTLPASALPPDYRAPAFRVDATLPEPDRAPGS